MQELPHHADTLILHAGQLLTLRGGPLPRAGEQMNELSTIVDGGLAISDGKIIAVDDSDELIKQFRSVNHEIDAEGRLVLPGFVDPHTHLVFAGSREHEMARKAAGETYLDILKSGGGIHSTVRATRKADEEELFELGIRRLNLAAAHGTTSIEIKSGYGLEPYAEQKMLHVIQQLNKAHVLDIVPTFLGAHIVPLDWERQEYLDWIIQEALPEFKHLATFCDVFCEEEAFTVQEMESVLTAAKQHDYGLKAHVGQFHSLGAAGRAAELGALSVEHLDFVNEDELDLMRVAGTVGILLPGATFFTGAAQFPNPHVFIEHGVPLALATDFNPGSCPCLSMQMIIALACIEMKMTAAQAIVASTINAAHAIGMADRIGSLQEDKQADIVILNIETPEQLPYYFGVNLVDKVIKSGKLIYE